MKIKIAAIIVAILILPGITIAYGLNTVDNAVGNTTEDLFSEPATDVEVGLLLIKTNGDEGAEDTADNLEMTVTTDYNLHEWIFEPVEITIALGNPGEKDQILTFSSSKTCDFIVRNKRGQKIYQWSDGGMFAQIVTDVTIPAGETWFQNLTWKQIRPFPLFPLFHCKVLPGTYDITGQIPTLDRTYEDTVQIRIAFGVVHPLTL